MPLIRKRVHLLKQIDLQTQAVEAGLRGEVFLQKMHPIHTSLQA